MKYKGLVKYMWLVFAPSFKRQLSVVFSLDKKQAKQLMRISKEKYKEIISGIDEFEKTDRFKMNIISCAMLCSIVLNMSDRPSVEDLTKYYEKSMMIPLVKVICKKKGKFKFSKKDIEAMKTTAKLKAADRNPYSWNMDYLPYDDGSGYETRFYKCGICSLMKKYGLFDLTQAMCKLDYAISEASQACIFVRKYTLSSGGPYCDCGYKKKEG